MQNYQMLIGGEWVDAADGQVFETMNPYLGKPWATIPRGPRTPRARSPPPRQLFATARGPA
jgi:acyl-CoA reductase-like NAD-dependent aldehyde dehydrogenase